MSHIIFRRDSILEDLSRELSPLVRLIRVNGHLETSGGKTIDTNLIPVAQFEIILMQFPDGNYWRNSCTWCYEYEKRIVDSGAVAYELKPLKDEPPLLHIPIQLYGIS